MKLSITEKARQEPKVSCSEHCRQQLPLPELVEQRGEIELLRLRNLQERSMNLKLRCLRRGVGSANAEVSQLRQEEPAL